MFRCTTNCLVQVSCSVYIRTYVPATLHFVQNFHYFIILFVLSSGCLPVVAFVRLQFKFNVFIVFWWSTELLLCFLIDLCVFVPYAIACILTLYHVALLYSMFSNSNTY